jgi:hypothetical protein
MTVPNEITVTETFARRFYGKKSMHRHLPVTMMRADSISPETACESLTDLRQRCIIPEFEETNISHDPEHCISSSQASRAMSH